VAHEEKQQHKPKHARDHDDDEVREIEESVEADLPPTELSVERSAAHAAEENSR
jgi:hypothetical protein